MKQGKPAIVTPSLDLEQGLGFTVYPVPRAVSSYLTKELRRPQVTLPRMPVVVGRPPLEPLLKQTLTRVWPAWACEAGAVSAGAL